MADSYTDGYGFDNGSDGAYTDSYGFDNVTADPYKDFGYFGPANPVDYTQGTDLGYTGSNPVDYTQGANLGVLPDGLTYDDLKSSGIAFDPSTLDGVMGKLKSVANALGFTKSDGGYDWKKLLALGGAGLTMYDALNRKEVPVKTAAQLAAGLPSNAPPGFSQGALTAMQQPMLAGNQLSRQASADMPSPIRPGVRGYAEGGEVEGPLSQSFDSSQALGAVSGDGGGQDDMISARLSPGEYVFDAESVSMLGDGDNAAGARKLDELRAAMRAHKRSAPPDEIAPKSMGALSYLNGGLNG